MCMKSSQKVQTFNTSVDLTVSHSYCLMALCLYSFLHLFYCKICIWQQSYGFSCIYYHFPLEKFCFSAFLHTNVLQFLISYRSKPLGFVENRAVYISYSRRDVHLQNLLEVYFYCYFSLISYFFPLYILLMIVRLASLIFDTSMEFRYTCVVL